MHEVDVLNQLLLEALEAVVPGGDEAHEHVVKELVETGIHIIFEVVSANIVKRLLV